MDHSKRKEEHIAYQRDYFDNHGEFFRQPIPDEIVERTKLIVQASGVGPQSRVLDVGTGMGALLPHMLERGVEAQNILGCDLSYKMLEEARSKFPDVRFWQGDFSNLDASLSNFDAIFFNACFGNLFDPDSIIEQAKNRLTPGGRIVISHPLGNNFVRQLKESDEKLVLSELPDRATLERWCASKSLSLKDYRDEEQLYLAILQK